jgi:phosphoketolase
VGLDDGAGDRQADAHALALVGHEGLDAYWRAANYLSVGQMQDNPLLESPLERKHMGVASPKPGLTGPSTSPSNLTQLRARRREPP